VKALAALINPAMYDEIFKDVEREKILCEMMDWVDPDEEQCDASGGEEQYYGSNVTPSYERKNAPFDSLEELQLVHGIGDDFWTAFVEPDAEDPASRVLTVWGSGKINVNTANTETLFASLCMLGTDRDGNNPCSDLTIRINLVQLLQSHENLKLFLPLKNGKDFLDRMANPEKMFRFDLMGFTIPAVNRAKANKLFTTRSRYFSIYATGTAGNATRKIHVVVDSQPKMADMIDPAQSKAASGGKILYWRME
jgi:general secretion pathway protein K